MDSGLTSHSPPPPFFFFSKVSNHNVGFFKGGHSDFGTRILQKSSLYSQSLLIFIHKIPVVETIRQQENLEIYYGPGRHRQETVYFYMSSSLIYILEIHKASNIAYDEDINMENNYMLVM